MEKKKKKGIMPHIELNPVRILALSFMIVILIGGLLLSLPISSKEGNFTPFIDALFTSTSAVCVTGLVTLDTGTYWSIFGKSVILTLIQIGGLGFMSFTTLSAIYLGKKLGLKERLLMMEAYNALSLQGIIKMVKYVVFFTFGVELTGALILATQFVPKLGFARGMLWGLWHSVSAFCNAGFDLLGNFSSLTTINTNKVVLLTIATLIAVGGLGFSVWMEIWNSRDIKKLSFHAKMVISITLMLIFGGALAFFLLEFNNAKTMQDMRFLDKIVNSIFTSVTPRTAGFNSISTSEMTLGGRFLTILLMFIGGSPGSTAGGVKTTTLGILFLIVWAVLKGRHDPEAFGKRIAKDMVYKAFTVFTMGLLIVGTVILIMSFSDPYLNFEQMLYEATSAFATVGLTEGITPGLHMGSKIALIGGMFLGRVGPLTVLIALSNFPTPANYKYPEGKIMIG